MRGVAGIRARVDAFIATIAGITLLGFVLRLAVLLRPIGVIDRLFVPDDTYYTLTIARSIAHGHGPTVDGTTLTSGFQALLGFVMVPVFWITKNPDTALRVDLAFLVVVDTLTIVALAWVAYRFAGRVAAVVAASLWAISPVAISMALGGLETSLAILAAVSLVGTWMWANEELGTKRAVIMGAVAGLAVLARVDLLLLVGLLVALQLWRGPRRPLLPAALAGAAVVAPWWIWCTVEFGTPVPTSGPAAHNLAPLRPFSHEAFAQVAGAVVGGPFVVWRSLREDLNDHAVLGVVVFFAVVVALLAVAVWWSRRRSLSTASMAALPAFAAGLLLFYAWFGVGWYFTRYLAPVACVVSLILAVIVARVWNWWKGAARWRGLAVIGTLLVIVVGVVAAGREYSHSVTATRATASGFDSITGYRDAARTIAAIPKSDQRLGAWQSGAFGYYANGRFTVVNLDGVVNPDAERATRAHRLPRYIKQRRLDWLADFTLHIVGFVFADSKRLHPQPSVETVKGLPQFPPFPEYGVARVRWPPRS
jgi:hypothetical protein